MNIIPIEVVALVSFPEGMLVAALGFRLVGVRLGFRPLALFGLVDLAFSLLIWLLPLPFGYHTLILTLIMIGTGRLVTRVPGRVVIVGILAGLIVYIMVEMANLLFVLSILKTSLPVFFRSSGWLRVASWIPQAAAMLLLILLHSAFPVTLIGPAGVPGGGGRRMWRRDA